MYAKIDNHYIELYYNYDNNNVTIYYHYNNNLSCATLIYLNSEKKFLYDYNNFLTPRQKQLLLKLIKKYTDVILWDGSPELHKLKTKVI